MTKVTSVKAQLQRPLARFAQTTKHLRSIDLTIQIKDMSVSNEIDVSEMGAVRGGSMNDRPTVGEFTYYANAGLLNNPVTLIQMASQVDLNPDPE